MVRNPAASARDRLLAYSRERKEDHQFILQRYAAERFLYRLGQSEFRDRFVLKGAMLFSLWGGSLYRATRDLDFTGYGKFDATGLMEIIRKVCLIPCLSDGIEFRTEDIQAESIRDQDEYHGFRIRLKARLTEALIPLQIDVGFGNAIEPGAQEELYPVLLDQPAPYIRAYPRESIVAEKLHALVVRGSANSRLKDFYDLFALAKQFQFDGEALALSISATFKRRKTMIPTDQPVGLSPGFYADSARSEQWRRYLQRNNLPGAPLDFDQVGDMLRSFLGPLVRDLAEEERFHGEWLPGGAWSRR